MKIEYVATKKYNDIPIQYGEIVTLNGEEYMSVQGINESDDNLFLHMEEHYLVNFDEHDLYKVKHQKYIKKFSELKDGDFFCLTNSDELYMKIEINSALDYIVFRPFGTPYKDSAKNEFYCTNPCDFNVIFIPHTNIEITISNDKPKVKLDD